MVGHYICGELIVKKGDMIVFNTFGLLACSISVLGFYQVRVIFPGKPELVLDIAYIHIIMHVSNKG